MSNFRIGDLVSFTYPAVHQEGTKAHDKFPEVLVLHPNYEGLLHGLNFNYMDADEINTIRMLLDPFFEMQQRENLRRRNPSAFAELERIITTPGAYRNTKINSPVAFYKGVIRPFIKTRGWDPYRKYSIEKIKAGRVIQPAAHMTGEDSLAKYKKEHEEMSKALQQALSKAQTAQQLKEIERMKQELERSKALSQRQSVLKKFADFITHFRGPRIKY
jgi:hypothetical protein